MNQQIKQRTGFTIIEVVLVLAIAGLIFMMVFIALPALQRTQRDMQRKDDLARMMTELTHYTSNNRGSLPNGTSGWNSFETSYLLANNDTFVDPAGAASGQSVTDRYNLKIDSSGTYTDLTSTSFSDAQNMIYVAPGAICNASDSAASPTYSGQRKVAIRMVLEGGGVSCQNN
ncbi:prepilin-type N-terminal cleavage/methylation domain-containing protein [Candidatus Saccharibacteria bacterium]|nr:prepilin-type N-terminal cleavage/methylation domain-containing protein [Candidatus Saccharibacteria bacterium]